MDYNKNGKIDSEDLLIEESMKNNYSGNSYHGALKGFLLVILGILLLYGGIKVIF